MHVQNRKAHKKYAIVPYSAEHNDYRQPSLKKPYTMLHNSPCMKNRRKELRKNTTPAEQRLWRILRNRNLAGHKFRRQHSVGPYVLDFYCPAHKLAIELDGDTHFNDEAEEYDKNRTNYLNSMGIKELRFLNTDVFQNLDGVSEKILHTLER
jgi:very-short-patch-repair endonuclease